MKILKRLLVLTSFIVLQSCASTSIHKTDSSILPVQKLQNEIYAVFSDSIMAQSNYSAMVKSMDNGDVLFSHNSQTLFHPASNMKLLTTATALSRLGVNYFFRTLLTADSAAFTTTDTIIHGNLYLKGGGNPELELTDLLEMVDFMKSNSIRSITGDLIADDTFLDSIRFGHGWMWDDDPATYFPHLSALSLEKNVTKIIVTPGDSVGDTLKYQIIPYSPGFSMSNSGITIDTLLDYKLKVDRDWMAHRNHFEISGNYPINAGPDTTWLNVENPAIYTISTFYSLLQEAGINIQGGYKRGVMPKSVDTLFVHKSDPLSLVIYNTNKVSDNLAAELILKTMAAEITDTTGTAKHGLTIIRQFLQEIGADSTTYRIVDGSGASHYNLVTSDLMIQLLDHMYHKFNIKGEFLASLPIGGVDGTLERRMKSGKAFENLRAKTGTVSGVSALSGYISTVDNEVLAFSILMQNFIGSSWPYRTLQDRVGEILANFSRMK